MKAESCQARITQTQQQLLNSLAHSPQETPATHTPQRGCEKPWDRESPWGGVSTACSWCHPESLLAGKGRLRGCTRLSAMSGLGTILMEGLMASLNVPASRTAPTPNRTCCSCAEDGDTCSSTLPSVMYPSHAVVRSQQILTPETLCQLLSFHVFQLSPWNSLVQSHPFKRTPSSESTCFLCSPCPIWSHHTDS